MNRILNQVLVMVLAAWALAFEASGQCPTLVDDQGEATENLTVANCSGNGTIFLSAGSDWSAFVVDWGDGSGQETFVDGMLSGGFISHDYPATPAVYEAVLTEQAPDGCSKVVEVIIEEPANASIQIPFGGVTSACAPQAMEFTNSSTDVSPTTQFTWSFGDGSEAIEFGAENAGATISHTYVQGTVDCETSVILTAENHCNTLQGGPSTAEFQPILIWDVDDAAIEAANDVLCYPNVTTTVTNATERNCFEQGNISQRFEFWNFGDLDGDGIDEISDWSPWPAADVHELTFPGIGTYEIMLVDSSLCGRDTVFKTIEVMAPPVSALNLNGPTTICEDEQIQFHQMASGVTYKWNFGTSSFFITTVTGHVSYTFQNPGVYDVTSVVLTPGANNTSGCTDTSTVTITVLPKPDIDLSVDDNTGCGTLATVATADGPAGTSYVWELDGIEVPGNGENLDVEFAGVGSHVIDVVGTTEGGCSSSAATFVNIYPEPEVSFETSAVCEGQPTEFTDLTTIPNGAPITGWHWMFGEGGQSYSQNADYQYAATGLYLVTLTVETPICEASGSQFVQVLAAPEVSLAADVLAGCAPLDVEFTADASAAAQYEWVFGDGLALNTGQANSVAHTYTGTLNTATTHTATVTVTSADGCSASDAITVETTPGVTAAFTPNLTNACAPFGLTLDNTSVGADSYVWHFGDGTTSTEFEPTHVFENTSGIIETRTVSLVATSANGCVDSTAIALNIFPEAIFNFELDELEGCSPLVMEMPAIVSASNHVWDFGDGETSTMSTPDHSWSNDGDEPVSYTIGFSGTNAFGCSGTTTADITVNPQPIADFSVSAFAGCTPLDVALTDASAHADALTWTLADGTILGSDAVLSHSFATSGAITLTATDAAGCSDSRTENIEVYPAAEISLNLPMISDCSPLDIAFSASGNGVISGDWNFGDGTLGNGLTASHSWANDTDEPVSHLLSFTGVTANGCETTVDTLVTVNPQPVADFTMSESQGCAPLFVDLADASTHADAWIWDLGNGTTLSTQAGTMPAGLFTQDFHETVDQQIATYTLTLTAMDAAGCSDVHTEELVVYPKAKFDLTLPFDSACSPLSIDLAAIDGAVDGTWDFGDGTTGTGLEVSHEWTNWTGDLASHVVTFDGVNEYGCPGTIDTTVYVKPQPLADFDLSAYAGCAPFNVTFTNNSLRADSYHWIYGDGHENEDLPALAHNFEYEGDIELADYEVMLIAADEWGCFDTKIDSVTVFPELHAEISGVLEGCAPFAADFAYTGGEAIVMDWDFGNGTTGAGPQVAPTFDTPAGESATYNVAVAAMSVHGCSDLTTVTVTVHPKPVPALSLSAEAACAGTPVLVYHDPQFADSVILDLGDGNTFVNPDFESLEIMYNGEGQRLVTSTLFTDAGCSATASVLHTVHPAAIASFEAPAPACSPLVANFENNVVLTGTDYSWDFGDGNTSDLENPAHLYENTTSADSLFIVTLTATTEHGCVDTSTADLIVHGTPVAGLALNTLAGCYPLEVTFANLSEGATGGTLNFGTGEVEAFNPADSLIEHTYYNVSPQTVNYTAVLTVINEGGCTATDQVAIEVSPAVDATFDVVETGCSPLNATFVNSSFGATEYIWTFGDGAAADVSQPTHTFVNASNADTTFVVTLVAVSAAGCTDTASVGIDVYPVPVADFAVSPPSQIYPSSTITITNLSMAGNSATTTWTMGDGTVYEGPTPPAHEYDTWGTYFITAEVDNGYCSDVATTSIEILAPNPVAAFSGGGEGCAPLLVSFENETTHGVNYFWEFGDGSSATDANPVHVYQTPGVYNVRLVVTGYEGVIDEVIDYATVEVYPTAIAAFTASPNQVVAPDESVYFINGSSADVSEWLWDFGDGNLSTLPAPVHSYDDPGFYTVTLTVNNYYNCPSSITVENAVEAIPGGYMNFPSAFTPTPGDHTDGSYDPMSYDNDVFHPDHRGIVTYELLVFNKWGEMVFASHDPNIGWNGRVNGELARQDVYAWRAQAVFSDGHTSTKAGDVTLMIR